MLTHSREYSDGKYYYGVIPFENLGNVIILENKLTNTVLKKYFTEDDETAIAVFESLIQLQEDRGDEQLENYKIGERMGREFTYRIRVDQE